MSDNEKLQKMIDGGANLTNQTWHIDPAQPVYIRRAGRFDFTGSNIVAIPNGEDKGALIRVAAGDVTLIGGNWIGDRKKHKNAGPYGNGAHGIALVAGSAGVTLTAVECREHMGDGIYIDGVREATIYNVRCIGNRRQGMSIVSGKQISITKSFFANTSGTKPEDGIDLEPDKGDAIDGVTISGNTFSGNAGAHIELAGKRGSIKNVTIKLNIFDKKSIPIKIQGTQPPLLARLKALWGDYSGYPKEVTV
jgi:hypothetical protein